MVNKSMWVKKGISWEYSGWLKVVGRGACWLAESSPSVKVNWEKESNIYAKSSV